VSQRSLNRRVRRLEERINRCEHGDGWKLVRTAVACMVGVLAGGAIASVISFVLQLASRLLS